VTAGSDTLTGGWVCYMYSRSYGAVIINREVTKWDFKALQPTLELMNNDDDDDDDDDDGTSFHTGISPPNPIRRDPHLSICMRCPCCCSVVKCVFVNCDIDGKHQIHMKHVDCTCEESRV
jgi:hypothetical protein